MVLKAWRDGTYHTLSAHDRVEILTLAQADSFPESNEYRMLPFSRRRKMARCDFSDVLNGGHRMSKAKTEADGEKRFRGKRQREKAKK